MKITHVKIRNYRNLRDIDIGLAETVAIIGENNSGKSNFLKAITLPFLTDDNTHISKKLSWIDINNETKKCYYKKIILNQNKIRNDEITVEQFAEFLPTVSVEVNIQASGAEEYYVKDIIIYFMERNMKKFLLQNYHKTQSIKMQRLKDLMI